jgi:hypothetical protein
MQRMTQQASLMIRSDGIRHRPRTASVAARNADGAAVNGASHFGRIADTPVFICGHPRSGTTLLASLLDGHPQLSVFPEELNFFHHIYRRRDRGRAVWSHSGFKIIAESPLYADIDRAELQSRVALLLSQGPDERALLKGLIAIWHDLRRLGTGQERHWVEKTPKSERWAGLLDRWFGGRAIFLHILRDPRDNFVAYRRSHPRVGPLGFANRWRYSAALGIRNAARLPNYHLLRYEDLVLEPVAVMGRVAGLIGILPDPVLYTPTKNGRSWGGNSSEAVAFSGISASQVGKHRTQLSRGEISAIERLTGPYIAQFGYEGEVNAGCVGLLPLWTSVRLLWRDIRMSWMSCRRAD